MRLGWLFAICLSPELDGHFNGAEARAPRMDRTGKLADNVTDKLQ